ncbi:spartin-like isoform X2 [Tubulanus polymorphus]|uniref:spartin-like isoform X2 n=1 Tax=Tubulanus polymorphus TaxID=672921 RepID=UPI003DA31E96
MLRPIPTNPEAKLQSDRQGPRIESFVYPFRYSQMADERAAVDDMSLIIYRSIQRLSEEAFLYIDQALNCDHQGQSEQAVVLYGKALDTIDKASNVNCNAPENNGAKRTKSLALQEKLRITQTQIRTRVDDLGSNVAVARALADPPPSYEESVSPTESKSSIDRQFQDLGDELMTDGCDSDDNEAVEIFCLIEGVQIYYITPEGYVSAPSYPSSLRIFQFSKDATSTSNRPPAFLQVGDWTYPFLAGTSPSLLTNIGAYVFPDPLAEVEGSAVGVILPESVTAEQRLKFEQMLDFLTCMRTQQQVAEEPRFDDEQYEVVGRRRTSETISRAAEWISWGIKKGAEKSGELMQKGSEKLKERLEPEGTARSVDPRVKQGLEVARKASGVAVKVSSCVVNKLGQATMAVGRHVAPHLRRGGEKILPRSWTSTDSPDGQSKMDAVFEVAGSGLLGFATIYSSLEHAAKALARNIRDETVVIVDHKYGKEAAGVTHTSLSTAGNALMTAHNVSALGAKAIAKRVAKDAGAAVVEDVNNEQTKKKKKSMCDSENGTSEKRIDS